MREPAPTRSDANDANDNRLLVEGLRRGDREAFREVYARYAGPTFGFLARLCGARDRAEDLHQETWMAVARTAARLDAESDLAAWIFTIARNQFRSAQRSLARLRARESVPPPSPLAVHPHDDPAARDLEKALQALPAAHREILLLVGVEGLALDRAAAVLDLRPDAARQRLARARAALTERLAAGGTVPDLSAMTAQRGAR
jgi:RNA polymerase sigma-70 factor (ECF subfamily)